MKADCRFGQSGHTRILRGDSSADLDTAAAFLRSGGMVAMPTETVYGLAANALDAAAVAGIFRAKQRPGWDPLIVHLDDISMVDRVAREVSEPARRLMDAFWPGPLTLLLPRCDDLPATVTAGRDRVGVRIPAHPVARDLIRRAGVPLAAPSANRFGHISPTSADHVLADLDGRIDAVLDAGPTAIGVESTVFDPDARMLYRQGGVSQRSLEDALGCAIEVYQAPRVHHAPESLPSPGVGIRHYAPRARVVLVNDEAELTSALQDASPKATGVMLPAGWSAPHAAAVFAWERWDDPAALARTLYAGLRALDAAGVRTIVVPLPSSGEGPLVEAIRDRLMKSAREQ